MKTLYVSSFEEKREMKRVEGMRRVAVTKTDEFCDSDALNLRIEFVLFKRVESNSTDEVSLLLSTTTNIRLQS